MNHKERVDEIKSKVAQIRALLEVNERDQAFLARGLNTSEANIGNWLGTTERGLVKPRNTAVYDEMMRLLQPSDVDSFKAPTAGKVKMIRFAGEVPGGDWGDPLESEEFIDVYDIRFEHPQRFAANVKGLSCFPFLRPNDFTIWHVDKNPRLGSFVLAQRRGDLGCTLKELAQDPSGTREILRPANPAYEQPEDGEGWDVIARLVAVVFDVEGSSLTVYDPKGVSKKKLRFRENIVEDF